MLDRDRLVALARKGNGRALAYLFQQALHPRRLTVVKTRYAQGTLRLLVESVDGVAPPEVFKLLRLVLTRHNIQAVRQLKVYARRRHQAGVDWVHTLTLRARPRPPLHPLNLSPAERNVNFLKKVEFPQAE